MSYTNLIFSRFDFVLLQIVLQETEIMNQGKTVFAQSMSLISRYEFDKCVKRYNGNIHAIEFKCRELVLNLGHSPLYRHFYKCLYIEMLKISQNMS